MGAYMYPITIKREPKKLRYVKEFDLPASELSIKELQKYVSDSETFQINSEEAKIYVYGTRCETMEETQKRVEKEEKYMENYEKFHKNKK